MQVKAIKELISQGESEWLEMKLSTGQRTEAAKTVCGMLNNLGGYVFFGVNDQTELVGQDVSDKTLRDLTHEFQKIEPPVFPEITTAPLENDKTVIAVTVPGGGGPYTYDGRPCIRLGSSTMVMPKGEYEKKLLEKMHATSRWENQVAAQLRLEDLDHNEIIRTVEEAVRRHRLDDPGVRTPLDLLRGLGLLDENDRLLNAAAALFLLPEKCLPSFPQCQLRLARFKGLDKTEFLDNRKEFGNAFSLLIKAQRFFRDHLPIAGRIEPGVFERVDEPLFPPDALREALANALCHRDYSEFGGSVSVALFDDRLEVASPGELPFGLTPEQLKKPHSSRPWNPLMANVFYRRGIIETWGRGTLKIIDLLDKAGLPTPEFFNQAGSFVVIFRIPEEKWLTPQDTPQVTPHDAPQVEQLLEICIQPLSRQEMQDRLGLKDREHFRKYYLKPALDAGLIEQTIPQTPKSKFQKYRLAQAGRNYLQNMKKGKK